MREDQGWGERRGGGMGVEGRGGEGWDGDGWEGWGVGGLGLINYRGVVG